MQWPVANACQRVGSGCTPSQSQAMDASSSRAASPAGRGGPRPAARPARGGSDLLLSVLSAGDVAMWGASATRSGARCALRCAWRPARAAACAWRFTGAASARSHEQDKKTSPWNLPFVSMLGGLGCAARPVRSSLSLSLPSRCSSSVYDQALLFSFSPVPWELHVLETLHGCAGGWPRSPCAGEKRKVALAPMSWPQSSFLRSY